MFQFQQGDKIFHYANADLGVLGWVVVEIAGRVLDTQGEQVEILSYTGRRVRVEVDTLAPRADDGKTWYAIDNGWDGWETTATE